MRKALLYWGYWFCIWLLQDLEESTNFLDEI